ncbi:hypothetical protein [Moraxella cuniculi]|nr:hypothetical protein [Moraxella cuniculi]OOS08099.1 hypothetical protein B0189_01850 [Moraxella cuniculi]
MNANKIMLIAPVLMGMIASIEQNQKYYFDFYEFFAVSIISLMFFVNIWRYIYGKDFWSLGVKVRSNEHKLSRFFWFSLTIICYSVGIFYFLFRV